MPLPQRRRGRQGAEAHERLPAARERPDVRRRPGTRQADGSLRPFDQEHESLVDKLFDRLRGGAERQRQVDARAGAGGGVEGAALLQNLDTDRSRCAATSRGGRSPGHILTAYCRRASRRSGRRPEST